MVIVLAGRVNVNDPVCTAMTEPTASSDQAPPPPPSSASLRERARRHIPGGVSHNLLFAASNQPYAVSGSGWQILDADGRELIDMHANHSALVHGNAFAPVLDAIAAACADEPCCGLPTSAEVELAEYLAQRVPTAPMWRFAASGSEAMMAAVRAARAFTERDLIVRFAGYSGGSDALQAPGARGVPASAQADVRTLSLTRSTVLIQTFEEMMRAHSGRVAAVVLDPLPNLAGLRSDELDFVRRVREHSHLHRSLLILDETITFRLDVSGMHALYKIEPDLIALGSLIGGGLPCGALGGREEVMAVFDLAQEDPVALPGTLAANPISLRAGLAALRALDEVSIARANSLGERLHADLRARGHPISGQGSLLKVHSRELPALWRRLYDEGVLIAPDGLFCVSTVMMRDMIEDVALRFRRALGE